MNIVFEEKISSVEVYTTLGQKVNAIGNTKFETENHIQIDTSSLNDGIYILKIKTSLYTQNKCIIVKK